MYDRKDNKWYNLKHCVWSDTDNEFVYRGVAIYVNGNPVHESKKFRSRK